MAASGCILSTCTAVLLVLKVSCWDTEDLELFDVVEEINANFYEVLDVKQGATASEIRKAYRKLSLQLHPDRNKAPDAEEKFRQLVAVYEVLKDEKKRQRYNEILQHGLPDWRQPVFYYRRVRKMGILELVAPLFTILTVGQYLVVWSIYFEKKITIEEIFAVKKKKSEKKSRKKQALCETEIEKDMKEELEAIPRPQLKNLWPVKLTIAIYHLLITLPTYYQQYKKYLELQKERKKREEEHYQRMEAEAVSEQIKKPKKRHRIELPEYSPELYSENAVIYTPHLAPSQTEENESQRLIKSGTDWSEDEFALLFKAVAKFPGGTTNRWERIAEMVGRPVSEVISRSKEIKGMYIATISPALQGKHGESMKTKPSKHGQQISDAIISTKEDYLEETESAKGKENQPNLNKEYSASKTENQTLPVNRENADSTANLCPPMDGTKNIGLDSSVSRTLGGEVWTKNQQTILEWTLRQYPKGTEQRWEKIASHIPDKSKDDCIKRCKLLIEMVKKKKMCAAGD